MTSNNDSGIDFNDSKVLTFPKYVSLRDQSRIRSGNVTNSDSNTTTLNTLLERVKAVRERVCPDGAISVIARYITRCQPPRLTLPGNATRTSEKKRRRKAVEDELLNLRACWKVEDIEPIPSSFKSCGDHARSFLLPLLEESREAALMSHEVEGDCCVSLARNDECHRARSGKLDKARTRWYVGEVVNVMPFCDSFEADRSGHHSTQQNQRQPQPEKNPAGLLSAQVYLLRMAVKSRLSSISYQKGTITQQEEEDFDGCAISGDLLYLVPTSSGEATAITADDGAGYLGIIQGYDPYYEQNYANYLHSEYESGAYMNKASSFGTPSPSRDASNRLVLNVIVCGTAGSTAGTGGWTDLSLLRKGSTWTFSTLGNMLNCLRESQAIRAVAALDRPLSSALLGGCSEPDKTAATALSASYELPSGLLKELQKRYNHSQLQCISRICDLCNTHTTSDRRVYLLQGPPGTGKTHTILGIVASKNEKGGSMGRCQISVGSKRRILICAPSNAAIDEIVYRILHQGTFGNDGKIMRQLKVVREMTEIRRLVETTSRWQLSKAIFDECDIICSTTSGAGSQPILEMMTKSDDGFAIDSVIIDEAAQATEPSSLIPAKLNPKKFILVGDPCQLPATVFSHISKLKQYDRSLFERLMYSGHDVMILSTQYRMHPSIAEFPSRRFYGNRLQCSSTVQGHTQPYYKHPHYQPIVFHNVHSSHERDVNNSYSNLEEAQYILNLYLTFLKKFRTCQYQSVGIIAPYRAQRRILRELFQSRLGGRFQRLDIEIGTIDGFQGREKDIIILSCVRAIETYKTNIGFLRDWRRLNVAITRSRNALWIIGSLPTLISDSQGGWDTISNLTHTIAALIFGTVKSKCRVLR
eukprot:GSChrysophyteH1.ASY1.ANO1.2339.1 assembled CDS